MIKYSEVDNVVAKVSISNTSEYLQQARKPVGAQ